MKWNPTFWLSVFTLLLVGVILSIAGLLVSVLSILLLTFAGVVFGVFLNGISRTLSRLDFLSYRWSYAIVVVTLLGSSSFALYGMGSQIWQQLVELSDELDSAVRQLQTYVSGNRLLREALPDAEELESRLTEGGARVLPRLLTGIWSLLWGVTAVAVILFVGLYVAYEPDLYAAGVTKLVSLRERPRAHEVLHSLRRAVIGWIVGRLISMAIVGLCTAAGLWLLGVPLPLTLGVLAALLTLIPNLGPVLAAIPQALIALQIGWHTVLYVLLFNLLLQAVESYLVTPIVQRIEVSLPPALTIVLQLFLGVVVGAIGVVMAAPLAVVSMTLIQTLYIRDELGDPEPGSLADGG